MKSMTGFGKGQASSNGVDCTVEISSVNRKQLDLRFNIPTELKGFEPDFRKHIAKYVSRGAVNVKFIVDYDESLKSQAITINKEVAAHYVNEFKALAVNLGISDSVSISDLVALPEVVTAKDIDLDADLFKDSCMDAMKAALDSFVNMRSEEGLVLKADLLERRKGLELLVDEIKERAPLVIVEYQEKLKERVQTLLQDMELDEDSLSREVAYFADRCDISEEVTRLYSHFQQFDKLVNDSKPVGRALDFLIQELFREINTTGSKANDAEIAKRVVSFKTELEKIREQVQNIE